MKLTKAIIGGVLAGFLGVLVVKAGDSADLFQLKNRLRVEYDDNIYQTTTDEQTSWKIIEELEMLLNFSSAQTYLGLRYRPSLVYWFDRPSEDTDFNSDLDLVFSHTFSPRLSLSVKDTFRGAALPELIDRGATAQENNDFIYNLADGAVSYALQPKTRIEAGGRYTLLRYTSNDEIAELDDYDILAAGLTLSHQLLSELQGVLEARYESTEYLNRANDQDRGSASIYAGAGFEEVFSPKFLISLRGGVQSKNFNDPELGDETAPYVDGSATFIPTPATRITVGAGYSLFEADVYPFANQQRLLSYVSLGHDITAKLSMYLSGSYQVGDYTADQSVLETGTRADGDEQIAQVALKGAYHLSRNNWLDVQWQFLTLNSDLRNDYDRNRFSVGWRTQF